MLKEKTINRSAIWLCLVITSSTGVSLLWQIGADAQVSFQPPHFKEMLDCISAKAPLAEVVKCTCKNEQDAEKNAKCKDLYTRQLHDQCYNPAATDEETRICVCTRKIDAMLINGQVNNIDHSRRMADQVTPAEHRHRSIVDCAEQGRMANLALRVAALQCKTGWVSALCGQVPQCLPAGGSCCESGKSYQICAASQHCLPNSADSTKNEFACFPKDRAFCEGVGVCAANLECWTVEGKNMCVPPEPQVCDNNVCGLYGPKECSICCPGYRQHIEKWCDQALGWGKAHCECASGGAVSLVPHPPPSVRNCTIPPHVTACGPAGVGIGERLGCRSNCSAGFHGVCIDATCVGNKWTDDVCGCAPGD